MNRETMPNEDVLSAFLDGECSDTERAWVQEQLDTSPGMRAVLDEVRAARDAVRALPLRDAPPEFWARLLADDSAAVVDLATQRARRRPARWVAAVAGAAAAAVIAAVVLVPEPESVTPPVATFTEAHAVRASLQEDAVSALVPLAVQAGFRR